MPAGQGPRTAQAEAGQEVPLTLDGPGADQNADERIGQPGGRIMDKNSADNSIPSCCSEQSGTDCNEIEGVAGESCAPSKPKKTWVRTLVFAVVMLTALGVGLYALSNRPRSGSSSRAGKSRSGSGMGQAGGCDCQKGKAAKPKTPCCGSTEHQPSEPSPTPCSCGERRGECGGR